MKKIIVPDPKGLKEKKRRFIEGGVNSIHVLTDFDRTLTKAFVDGKSVPSIISRLRGGNYISLDYTEKANALAEQYRPIETDPDIPLEEKKEKMNEWWTKHFDLLIQSGLNRKHIKSIVNEGFIQLRDGAGSFLEILNKNKIPLIIISSGGLGYDSIKTFLQKNNRMYENIHIVSNSFKWDKSGKAIGINEPIIHVFNKDEQSLRSYSFYNLIKNRKNVLLLGDSLGDIGMVNGFDYTDLIKIGFLNEKIGENLEDFKNNFDVILLNDTNMGYVNKLMEEIIA
jgi:5'-nucleotidase